MVLFFNSKVSEVRLSKSPRIEKRLNSVRTSSKSYNYCSRVDIAMYTISTYKYINFSKSCFYISSDTSKQKLELDRFIMQNFDVIDVHERIKNRNEILSVGKSISRSDPWIYYCPNDDHPFIAHNLDYLNNSIDFASKYVKPYNGRVSISLSHFQEMISCAGMRGGLLPINSRNIIGESKYAYAILCKKGNYDSVQVLHRDLFVEWYSTKTDCDDNVIRTESLIGHLSNAPQVVIVPKEEVCRHYDGYIHTMYGLLLRSMIRPKYVPPLFIPSGYFESKINIAYGYSDINSRTGVVTVNEFSKYYSFDSPNGVDIKNGVDKLPLAWLDKIESIALHCIS